MTRDDLVGQTASLVLVCKLGREPDWPGQRVMGSLEVRDMVLVYEVGIEQSSSLQSSTDATDLVISRSLVATPINLGKGHLATELGIHDLEDDRVNVGAGKSEYEIISEIKIRRMTYLTKMGERKERLALLTLSISLAWIEMPKSL